MAQSLVGGGRIMTTGGGRWRRARDVWVLPNLATKATAAAAKGSAPGFFAWGPDGRGPFLSPPHHYRVSLARFSVRRFRLSFSRNPRTGPTRSPQALVRATQTSSVPPPFTRHRQRTPGKRSTETGATGGVADIFFRKYYFRLDERA